MAKRKKAEYKVDDYRHEDKTRKHIPEAGIAGQGKVQELPKTRYSYDPHLPPVLRFDETGEADRIPELLQTAQQRKLTPEEAELLAEALRNYQQPWLEWSGKREKRWFEVDPVALHIHERVSAQAIIAAAKRQPLQPSLFADPDFEYREAVKFYEHNVEWSNRLILGDSLAVMHSLAKREDLAGKVQMIYMDPPYGIKFSSNFQPKVKQRKVGASLRDLTREPEQIKAYRDTWQLGVHSYLTYLRDRLFIAKELLTDSGSIFLQISDENLHRIRTLLDEIFGTDNFVSIIPFVTTSSQTSGTLPSTCDFIVWYAKNRKEMKYQQLYHTKYVGEAGGTKYKSVELSSGERNSLNAVLSANDGTLPDQARIFRPSPLVSQSGGENSKFPVRFQGQESVPRTGYWKTNPEGFRRLIAANRILREGRSLAYVRYIDDFPAYPLNNLWEDTWGVQSRSNPKIYVVQTDTKIIERCILMTTSPGDLVLDPTCGSGTTVYVAEQWGRRWITIDTSRVSIVLTRQRLLTATFDFYELANLNQGLVAGFHYKTVPHIMLRTIAQCQALDPIFTKWEPILVKKLDTLNAALTHVTSEIRTTLQRKLVAKEKQEGKRAVTDADRRRWLLPQEKWEEWEVPFDTDPDWPQPLQDALLDYRKAWRAKMDEVNATIAASAPQEVLVDQPKVVKNVLRVSGPFTVEGVQPLEMSLDGDESPIGGAPDMLDQTFEVSKTSKVSEDPINAEAYLEKMIRLLRLDGVRFPDNKVVKFSRLDPIAGSSSLHAEGEWEMGGETRRAAVAFGPQYGPLTAKQVESSLWSASRGGYDDLVFAAFSIDAIAQATIQDDPNPRVRCHIAHIRPDVNMPGDLLKDTPSSQLFTVSGSPRVRLETAPDGEFVVHMEGVDIYDPVQNVILPTKAGKVAAWFLDHDYNGRTFNISQAFFPDSKAWDKIAKALKTVVDPEQFAHFSGTQSLPFPAGEHKRAAVKVIDPRGNEVMKVVQLDGEVNYKW